MGTIKPSLRKILVIGAGIAGPAACYWLRRYGSRPTLIEKFPHIRKGGQALDIRGVACGLLKRMGIYERVCEMRTRIECGRYVDAHGHILYEEFIGTIVTPNFLKRIPKTLVFGLNIEDLGPNIQDFSGPAYLDMGSDCPDPLSMPC
ncbi:MAG TPA: NAD(P)-binding protein [Myxococcota bacterium]|nr:NAD(P)-binding protein [Myxococcota bacterium]